MSLKPSLLRFPATLKPHFVVKPKAFLSYSWTSLVHQQFVRKCAERLIADGVDVVLDIYDLKEGHDKHHFMERMVVDPSVTHVLLFCDKAYSEKADSRKSGVGTESQIVSKKIYEAVEQSKFIPLACEFNERGDPYLPTFLQSRIWIDFSSQEAVNANWEKLIRSLYGKPLHVKPELGQAPSYISVENVAPSNPASAKFQSLRQAILDERKSVKLQRRDFLDSCFAYAEQFRVRGQPDQATLGQKILADCDSLVPIRDLLVDWILLESEARPSIEFIDAVIKMFERIREFKSRPNEITSWQDSWFDAQKLFGYEVFLYTIAALLKAESYDCLHAIFHGHYLTPINDRYGKEEFEKFSTFYAYSEILNPVLSPPGQKLHSAAAELLKRHATRADLPFSQIIQADVLTLMVAFALPDTRWYPQTLYYSSHGRDFPFFVRAAQHGHFLNLAKIVGISDADDLRNAVKAGHERLGTERWNNFYFDRTFWQSMNMDKLDTLK